MAVTRKYRCSGCDATVQLTGRDLVAVQAVADLWFKDHQNCKQAVVLPPTVEPVNNLFTLRKYVSPDGLAVAYEIEPTHWLLMWDDCAGTRTYRIHNTTQATLMPGSILPEWETAPAPIGELPDEFTDEAGQTHVLCGCGHYVGTTLGTRCDYCPNCDFTAGVVRRPIRMWRPDRLTDKRRAEMHIL